MTDQCRPQQECLQVVVVTVIGHWKPNQPKLGSLTEIQKFQDLKIDPHVRFFLPF